MESHDASDSRMQALKGLHNILQEKDVMVQQYKDKARHYEIAFQQAESKIAKLLQLQSGKVLSGVNKETAHEEMTPTKPHSRESTLKQSPESSDSFILSDNIHLSGCSATAIKPDNGLKFQHHDDDLQTDGDTPSLATENKAILPGVSKVLFENVVKDNMKLRKSLQEALHKEGSNMKMMLERQEYADVIKQLRAELASKHQKLEEIEQWIYSHGSGQNQQLLIQLLDKQNKVQLFTKESKVKSAMIENCLKENKKLNEKIAKLEAEKQNLESVNEGTESVVLLKNLNGALQKQLQEERDLHQQQIARLTENQPRGARTSQDNDIEALQSTIANLESKLKDAEESKHMLKEQLSGYEDDYRTERENSLKQKDRYEKEISTLQLQVRKFCQENEKINKEWLKEKQKSQQLEGVIRKIKPAFFSVSGSGQQASCAGEVAREKWMNPNHPAVVVLDGLPDKNKKGVLVTDSGASKSSVPSSAKRDSLKGQFECPRCQRNDFKDVKHFEDHCKKCAQ